MVELIEIKKKTRGPSSREIVYKAIGKWVSKTVQRDTRPAFDEHGVKKLDEKGNEIRLPLEKDKDGKNIYVNEEVNEFVSDGVLTDIGDALMLVNSDEQLLLDCFADGFNERQYAAEADKDELDEFIASMELDDDQKSTFKRTARQLNRNYDMDILEAAEFVKAQMLRAKAKAEAKAKSAA